MVYFSIYVCRFFFLHLAVTAGVSGVRDIEKLHCQAATEPIRLFIFSFFPSIAKDELAVLQRRTAVELPAEPRITFTLCCVPVLCFPLSVRAQERHTLWQVLVFGSACATCQCVWLLSWHFNILIFI